jgi:Domain of unknown function (DUF6265)
MPRICAFAVVAMLGIPLIAQSSATTSDLAFLTGCWRFERDGQTVEEHWLAPAGGSLFGVSRTVAGGKTVDFEFLQLRDLPGGLTYIAKPSRQPEASFKMTTKTADEVVFENPQHDFPQRIRYRRSGDTLHARIEGTVDGKPRGIDYPYVRASCSP